MRCAYQVCQGAAGWRQAREVVRDVAADVGVGARVAGLGVAGRAGVVDVVGGLLPGVEDHLLVGVVRVQRGDDALDRVVEQHRADADLDAELEAVRVALKNGSYWRTGLPLLLKMVQPLPTQRGSTAAPPSTSGPGSAWIFFWISRPKPSE